MSRTLDQIDCEIRSYQSMLAALEDERKAVAEMSPEQQLATELHDMFCTHNHTDACDWYYGSWDKPRHAHDVWLKKAKSIMAAGIPLATIKKVDSIIRG